MVLDFEYGINTGNRFIDLVDHDEDPDEFIASQALPEEKPKKSTKDSKTAGSAAAAKKTTSKATTSVTASTSNVGTGAPKTNKENLAGKPTATDQRRPQSNTFGDNNNQQPRTDNARGGGRGFSRRGAGSAGQERPAYEGGGRGGGQQRTQRFPKYEGQQTSGEAGGFDQGGDAGGNDAENNNQRYGGYRGRGRGGDRGGDHGGRGTFYNRNYEGGRGSGRGRGRGGRGGFNNRSSEEGSQQQQQQPSETNEWQQNTEAGFNTARPQTARTGGQDFEADASLQEPAFESDSNRRGGRGHFRARTFHNNRNYGHDRSNQYDREGGDGGQEDSRPNRRAHDRQSRSFVSSVKPIEKKDGEGAHNWGNAAEIPDEEAVANELAETTDAAAPTPKNWSEQVDEAEKQMTLDEYKKQLEEKKRAQQEKLPQFNRRTAGEGEDPKAWQKFTHEYRKKTDNDESDEEGEEGSGVEDEEEEEEEQTSGKKKLITIPLRFKPIEIPRGGSMGFRGGPRRGGSGPGGDRGRYRDQPYRDEQQRPKSPSQQQPPVSEPTGEYQHDEQQQPQRPYRGGSRGQWSGRGEYRRSYGNSARGSHGGQNRSRADPNTPDFANANDFPTLAKQQE